MLGIYIMSAQVIHVQGSLWQTATTFCKAKVTLLADFVQRNCSWKLGRDINQNKLGKSLAELSYGIIK